MVRWAGMNANEQTVYRYDYMNRTKVSRAVITHDGFTSPPACAVSANQTGVVLYAWLSQLQGRSPQVQMANLTAAKQDPRFARFPPDIANVSVFRVRRNVLFT